MEHAPLDMRPGSEFRAWKKSTSFEKRRADTVKRRQSDSRAGLMQKVENRAIEMTFHKLSEKHPP